MKKLFAILGISVMSFCAFLGGAKANSYKPMYAENESSQVESSSEPLESSSENESEEPIDIEKETKETISDTAKDVIEVIKTIFNQKIVIAGVSISLGTLLAWVIGKVIVKVFDRRADKYERKLKDVLEKLGYSQEQIEQLIEDTELLDELVDTLIENTKNIQVKEKLLAIKEKGHKKVDGTKNLVVENSEKLEELGQTTQERIKEILEK